MIGCVCDLCLSVCLRVRALKENVYILKLSTCKITAAASRYDINVTAACVHWLRPLLRGDCMLSRPFRPGTEPQIRPTASHLAPGS